ncbi:hypothetical protein MKK88_01060 [Methylobacterium sp. E-005]|uniref:hypothetical protein n=1 Tax=Methylobacterium sp. E-005 TaxID=2836549 RepID=UPI001FB98386|nr:hypothetical protein [Methylobacterium sp. E-005]MCJ2084585.1 hypothetical protein [Methylobacterium sp. E-005]
MDRVTAYAGALIAETDPLKAQQNAMIALGWAAQSTLGTATAVDGFAMTPTTPASLVANLAPGAIYQAASTEATVWSSLPADSTTLVKQGLMRAVDPITFTPPSTNGYSQAFLVEVQYADLDTNPVLLPYYNAANPAQPYSGPGGNGQSQNTARLGIVAVQVKSGAAVSGTPTIPTPDAGWVGLYVVTLAAGATTITSGNIAVYTGAPFIPVKLPAVPAGVQSGQWIYAVDQGTSGALIAALAPTPTSLPDGMEIHVKTANPAAGSDVINVSGLGALPIRRLGGAGLPLIGDWAAGDILTLRKIGSNWQVASLLRSDVLSLVTGSGQVPVIVANPTLYVRSDGSDSNTGMANTAAGALLTLNAALTKLRVYYLTGQTATIQIGLAGTYALPSNIPAGSGTILIQGNASSPGSYTLSGAGTGSGSAVLGIANATVSFVGVRLYNTGSNNHTILSTNNALVRFDNCQFSSVGGSSVAHIIASQGGSMIIGTNNICDGNNGYFGYALSGTISMGGSALTFNSGPTFSVATFAASTNGSVTFATGSSFGGAVSGPRYTVNLNGVINTFGAGANFIPGSSAGTTYTGGQYA